MRQPGRVIHFEGNKRWPHGSPVAKLYVKGRPGREAEIDIIRGPVESGKTTASIAKAYSLICSMPRGRDGIRRSRGLIFRSTYGEIYDSILPDWLDWFPQEDYGKVKVDEPIRYSMKFLDVEAEIVFMAIPNDAEQTLRKLRSTQFTWAYGNEGQFNSLQVVTEVIDRTGRYPSLSMCPAYDRKPRFFMDMNAPRTHDHWTLYMKGETPIPVEMPKDQALAYRKPADWDFYDQPPAVYEEYDETGGLKGYRLNPKAENLHNMGETPYTPKLAGKPRDQIDRDFRNVVKASKSGAMRYPNFQRERHVAPSRIHALQDRPLLLGADGGASPAIVIGQKIDGGRYVILKAIQADNRTTHEFTQDILLVLTQEYPFAKDTGIMGWGDPALAWRSEHSQDTSIDIYNAAGIPMERVAGKDNPSTRWNIGRRVLSEFPDGEPKVLFCPIGAAMLVTCIENATMRTVKTLGGMADKEEIVKNQWSHPVEAWEYLLWGSGEDRSTYGRPDRDERKKGPIDMRGPAVIGAAKKSWASISRR